MPNVTIGSTIHLSPLPGTKHFQVQMWNPSNITIPPQDPATNDPDADNWVDVAKNPDGSGDVPISIWLTGQSLGNYTIIARAVDQNDNVGAETQLPVSYVALPAPEITIA